MIDLSALNLPFVQVTDRSAPVDHMSFTNSQGQQVQIYRQFGYITNGYDFPQKIDIRLEDATKAYPPGMYLLSGDGVELDTRSGKYAVKSISLVPLEVALKEILAVCQEKGVSLPAGVGRGGGGGAGRSE